MQALKALVIGLGLTIVLVVGVLVWGLFKKADDPEFKMFTFSSDEVTTATKSTPATTTTARPPAPTGITPSWGTVSLNLPMGCAIQDATTDLGRLYVRTGPTGTPVPRCSRITVLDPATGRILGTVTDGQ